MIILIMVLSLIWGVILIFLIMFIVCGLGI